MSQSSMQTQGIIKEEAKKLLLKRSLCNEERKRLLNDRANTPTASIFIYGDRKQAITADFY